MKRHISSTLVVMVCALVVAAAGLAATGGNGKGKSPAAASGSCTVVDNLVIGTMLPNGELLNFMVTDASGKTGWVLGFTDDGTWVVTVPARTTVTTYEFTSKTWGPNGSKYDVYASCSA